MMLWPIGAAGLPFSTYVLKPLIPNGQLNPGPSRPSSSSKLESVQTNITGTKCVSVVSEKFQRGRGAGRGAELAKWARIMAVIAQIEDNNNNDGTEQP